MNSFKVIKPGSFTTVQDKGREGYQALGIPVAGAMDDFSLRLANLLLGKPEYEAVLETTFTGPELIFNCDEVIALTGADMGPQVNGSSVAMWTSIQVKKGDKLGFTGLKSGLRGYIGFSRGLDLPKIMGSRSTFTRGSLGGFEGRALKEGDLVPLGNKAPSSWGRSLRLEYLPLYRNEETLGVLMGPQDDYFSQEAKEIFLGSTYRITGQSDRMGYRLEGPKIPHLDGADIISDAIALGAIQVPGQGQPIIMMADRQTTGGYSKLASVIKKDLTRLAQMGPGGVVRFKELSLEEAHRLYIAYEKNIKKIKNSLEERRFEFKDIRRFKVSLAGKDFCVDLVELD